MACCCRNKKRVKWTKEPLPYWAAMHVPPGEDSLDRRATASKHYASSSNVDEYSNLSRSQSQKISGNRWNRSVSKLPTSVDESLHQSAPSTSTGTTVISRHGNTPIPKNKRTATQYQQMTTASTTGTVNVELHRKQGETLGIGIAGGADRKFAATVSCLRAGSMAHRCDQIQIGDRLITVNNIDVRQLKHDEVYTLLKNAGDKVKLALEYDLQDEYFERPYKTFAKCTDVTLEKESGNYGFTMRGGAYGPDKSKSRPITVTGIRAGGPADREGRLRIGDRILSINGIDVYSATLASAQQLLSKSRDAVMLSIEYDVSIIDTLKDSRGPILLEIDKPSGQELGVILSLSEHSSSNERRPLFIQSIIPGSIADRCGALHIGDELLAIEGVSLEYTTLAEARQLLRGTPSSSTIKVQLIPHLSKIDKTYQRKLQMQSENELNRHKSMSKSVDAQYSTIKSRSSMRAAQIKERASKSWKQASPPPLPTQKNAKRAKSERQTRESTPVVDDHAMVSSKDLVTSTPVLPSERSKCAVIRTQNEHQQQRDDIDELDHRSRSYGPEQSSRKVLSNRASSVQASLSAVPCGQVCHSELMEVTLNSYSKGAYGLVIHRQGNKKKSASDRLLDDYGMPAPTFISYIERGSPAEKCGVLQVGDRIIAINDWHTSNGSIDEANERIRNSPTPITLTVEFDVIETVLPSSGVFTVKLAKRSTHLGIDILESSKPNKGEPIIVSDVRIGSVAHRCGSIHSGDRILSIDNIPCDTCTVDECQRLLRKCVDIVKLRIQKCDDIDDGSNAPQTVVYSIELSRRGGPLGITIASTDERGDPIIISQLANGGLAEKTGAIHVGDRIVAINNASLQGKRVSEAMALLQSSPDKVTLKIARFVDNAANCKSNGLSPRQRSNRNSFGNDSGHQRLSAGIDQLSEPEQNIPSTSAQNVDKMGTPIQSIDSAVESLEDSPEGAHRASSRRQQQQQQQQQAKKDHTENTLKYVDELREKLTQRNIRIKEGRAACNGVFRATPHDNTQNRDSTTLYDNYNPDENLMTMIDVKTSRQETTIAEAHCGDSGLGSSEHGQQASIAGANYKNCCACSQQGVDERKSPQSSAKEEWMRVLEALETVGEDEMLRKLEESIWSGSVPNCQHGPNCRPSGATSYTAQSQAPPIMSSTRLTQSTGGYQSTKNAASNKPANAQKGTPPPKPPYTPLSAPTTEQQHALRATSIINGRTTNESSTSVVSSTSSSYCEPRTSCSLTPTLPNSSGAADLSTFTACPVPTSSSITAGGGGKVPLDIIRVILKKDVEYNDYGFSVSDGVNQKGVFVNKIRPGGPADRCGNIRPFDKLLQVNGQGLEMLDCILAVPLLLSAADTVEMILCRDVEMTSMALSNKSPSTIMEEEEESSGDDSAIRAVALKNSAV